MFCEMLVPRPGIEPAPLAVKVLTTGPPGNSRNAFDFKTMYLRSKCSRNAFCKRWDSWKSQVLFTGVIPMIEQLTGEAAWPGGCFLKVWGKASSIQSWTTTFTQPKTFLSLKSKKQITAHSGSWEDKSQVPPSCRRRSSSGDSLTWLELGREPVLMKLRDELCSLPKCG